MELSRPKKQLNTTFSKFLAIKIFFILTLDKTHLEESGCLSNLHYLLAGEASK